MLDPRWQTTNVIDLIAAAVAERNIGLLLILSDALMDAGCDDEELLGYLRQQDATWFDLLDCYQAYWLVKHEGRLLEPDDVLNWMWRFSKSTDGTSVTYRSLKKWTDNIGALQGEEMLDVTELTPARFVELAERYRCLGETKDMGFLAYWDFENKDGEFWKVYETLTGEMIGDRNGTFFSCAC